MRSEQACDCAAMHASVGVDYRGHAASGIEIIVLREFNGFVGPTSTLHPISQGSKPCKDASLTDSACRRWLGWRRPRWPLITATLPDVGLVIPKPYPHFCPSVLPWATLRSQKNRSHGYQDIIFKNVIWTDSAPHQLRLCKIRAPVRQTACSVPIIQAGHLNCLRRSTDLRHSQPLEHPICLPGPVVWPGRPWLVLWLGPASWIGHWQAWQKDQLLMQSSLHRVPLMACTPCCQQSLQPERMV